jgi:FAD synthetase
MGKTAGIIIIGDEILSGKVHEDNSFFMAQKLWSHGIQLCRISVISDSVDEIAEEVRKFSEKFDYVFTSGGIGPTHDDITIEGISKAFHVRTIIDHTLKEFLEKRDEVLTPARLKMAEVPEGSELITSDSIGFPLIKFRNIFIFPGIPQLLRKKLVAIEGLFNEPQKYLKKVYINESETDIAPVLSRIVSQYSNVKIGSYPFIDNRDYSIMITLESLYEKDLNQALEILLSNITAENLIRVEG